MTSLNAPESLYTLQQPTIFKEKQYAPTSVMSYIWSKSPLFAHCIQTAALEDWFNSTYFNSTVLIPCREYSDLYLNDFIESLDFMTARAVVTASTIPGRVPYKILCLEECLPTYNKYNDLKNSGGLLNDKFHVVRKDVECCNGLVHVINGLVDPTYSV